jgi:probable F420-dependent oxidoreductase
VKYSISLFPLDSFSSIDEIVDLVVRAERLGFFSVGLAEHLFTPVGPPPRREPALPSSFWPDNFALGAALARETSRLRLLLSAMIVPYRHPLLAAQSVATLDWISAGRLDVTTGVGWLAAEFDALGISARDRGARTDEYLEAMIELWTAEYPRYVGRFVRFSDLTFGPRCVQRPHVPLLIGGNSERAFQRVVRWGAGWAPMLAEADVIRAGLARLAALLAPAGRTASGLRVFTRISVLGGNSAITRASAHVPGTVSAGDARDDSVEHTVEMVGRSIEAGVTELGLSLPWRDATEFGDRLEWFAREVMPRT